MKLHLKHAVASVAATLSMGAFAALPSHADSNPYLGDVMPVGFNFCPRGWAPAEGQILSISQNQSLYSLYGTTFGGDGRSTFALPDLRGRHAIGEGQGPGLSSWQLGQKSGSEQVTLNVNNLPSHNHSVNLVDESTNLSNSPVDSMVFARNAGAPNAFHSTDSNLGDMKAGSLSTEGGGMPVDVRSPYLAIKWCVALQGQFPPRN